MKKAICCLVLTGILFARVNSAGAQEIATDNKGEAIFVIPSSKKVIPEIALKNIGVNFTAFHLKKMRYFVKDDKGTKFYTMDKSTIINFKANLIDNSDDVLTINKDTKLTPHIEIGMARSIDALINPSKIKKYYTFAASVFADFQSFDLYDTVSKSFLPKYRRTSYGAKASFNIFFKTKSAIALNLRYKNAIVTDDETAYQKKAANTIYVDNNILTNGTTDGYLSPLTPVKNWRFSVAFPQFIKSKKAIAISPYYFVQLAQGEAPKNNAGVLFSVLNNKFRDFDSANNADASKKDSYTFETAFSVGFNLISTGSKSRSFLFISGTITIGDTKKKEDGERQKDKSQF